MGEIMRAPAFHLTRGCEQLRRGYLSNRALAKIGKQVALQPAPNVVRVLGVPSPRLLIEPLKGNGNKTIGVTHRLCPVFCLALG
jgi:hypothetical protein